MKRTEGQKEGKVWRWEWVGVFEQQPEVKACRWQERQALPRGAGGA